MKIRPKRQVLDNGLTVVTVPFEVESVAVLVLVRVGSRDETKKTNGISHFLEHMVFKGTEKWSTPQAMNQVIDSVGGMFNAFTSSEYTGFWVKLAKDKLDLGLEFLRQAVFESLLPGEELEKERGVILEEIKMYEDNPMSKVVRAHMVKVYDKTPLGKLVIGTPGNIKAFTREDFYDHLKKWYQPRNMIVGLAGGIDEKTMEKVKKHFAVEGNSVIKYTDKPVESRVEQAEPRFELVKRPIQQAHFCLGVRTFEATHKDRFVLGVLNTILGGFSSSRLFNEIREKRGLVYYVRSSLSAYIDCGDLVVQAGCDVNRIEEAIKVTRVEFEKLKQKAEGISKKELKMQLDYFKGRLALLLEDSHSVASRFSQMLLLEDRFWTVEEVVKQVEAVTVEDTVRVAKEIFTPDRLNLTVLGPFEGGDKFEKLLK